MAAAAVAILILMAPRAGAQDTGWVIERFESRFTITSNGVLVVREGIDVDFRGLSRHGILRDVDYRFAYDAERIREYPITLTGVTSADGRAYPVRVETAGSARRFRIGDPNRTVSGRQSYRIEYTVSAALNGFDDHDELYWNATGDWPVPISNASVIVAGPAGAIERVSCFQGSAGSTEPCETTFTGDQAVFTATRRLGPGEQLTIVTGLRKGAVAEPSPVLMARGAASDGGPSLVSLFAVTPAILASTAVGLLAAVGGVAALWWRFGRDRRFVAMYRDAEPPAEERVPLFGARPVGVEFEPPEGVRPGQMGLIVDERADTLDVTATIVDLAVRGYLSITEVPATGWFGRTDWRLERLRDTDAGLLDYERIVLDGLFEGRPVREVSALRNKFYKHLRDAKTALYRDAVDRGWFPGSPANVRTVSRLLGLVGAGGGVFVMVALGTRWGAGLVGLPVVVGGLALLLASGAMPRRTAAGRDLLHRTLGFLKYIRTAETRQLAFAERANIFTAYLPYAIAFKCVDKWARAFADIDLEAATATWYAGTRGFDVAAFESSLGSFSTSISNTLASTPGGSGGSGFSGGSSGGGGGGGGGGSW